MRIGQGVDVHAFSDDRSRPLILGGVILPSESGLAGHSDADVATHSVMDALLGAANLGDIGRHFPSDDPSLEGVSSIVLLERVVALLVAKGWRVVSADVTIVAQTPRLSAHVDAMAAVLTELVGVDVSVKATTTDHLGFIGRSEGIAALSSVLIEER